jgi:hypothetical protein
VRTTISISDEIMALAREVMDARRFSDFSGFLAQLIREEHERRSGPMILNDSPAKSLGSKAPGLAGKPIKYPPLRRAKK